ncbi:MAG: ATP synthase F0 subunit B [Deltaproteobacteria bacterium]|nr:MAG: ATP synthase F0 subunit B [Deltaproteobacteria bacterium]
MSWPKGNRARRLLATIGSCSFAILMTAGVVWASEGGQSMWPDFWQRVLNFVILVSVLVFVFKKLDVKSFFTKRTESIANTLNELETKKKEAEETYEKYKQKLAQLDKETDRILQEYVEMGEKEKAKIIANAEKAAADIRVATDLAIEQEIKSAKADLQRDIAEFSVTAAEALLKEKIGEEDQNKLVNDFMTKVVEAK